MRKHSLFIYFELLLGIILFIAGVMSFIAPVDSLYFFSVLFGIIVILYGVTDVIVYIRLERYTAFAPMLSLISGILSVMAGIMLVIYPNTGIAGFLILFPIWFIAHSVSGLTRLDDVKYFQGNGMFVLSLILNILGLILGLMMLFDPVIAIVPVSYFIGIYSILIGSNTIATAIRMLKN